MSWLFSRALVEEYLQESSSDGARSALSNGSPTPQAFLPSDKMTDFSRPSRFGMTFGHLTDDLGAELLTWFRGGSHVRTLARQERETGSTESAADYGPKWRGSFAKYDPDSCSWKTAQCSLLGGSDEFSETWPQWGLMLNGESFQHPLSGLPTKENESGLWAPTPTASDHKRSPQKMSYAMRPFTMGQPDTLAQWVVRESGLEHARLEPSLWEWMMGWAVGWTALKPLETVKFHNAQLTLGESLAVACE